MELSQLLAGLVSGGLTVTKAQKRYVAVVVSFGLGLAAFGLSIRLGYVAEPVGVEGWFNALWPVGASAFTASQVVLAVIRKPLPQPLPEGEGGKEPSP